MSGSIDKDFARQTRENEEAVLAAEQRGSDRVEVPPMKFTFEFTGDCNIHCFFCGCEFGRNEYRKQGTTKFGMSDDLFHSIADHAFPKATVINPTVVGEPFTFKHFDSLMEYAEKFDTRLEIVTNGMLMKPDRMRRLLPLLDRLAISFDGGTKETFEHCRSGAKWETVMENLRTFRDLRREMGLVDQVKFTFAITLMRENIEELSTIVEVAHEMEATEICASHLLVFTKELKSSSLFEHKELANKCILEGVEKARELDMKLEAPSLFEVESPTQQEIPDSTPVLSEDAGSTGMAPMMDPMSTRTGDPNPTAVYMAHESSPPEWLGEKGRYWCKFAWREIFVSHTGDAAPCCHQSRPVVGNVFEQDWDEIWNGETYRAIRRGLYEGKPLPFCASCSLLAEQGMTEYQEDGYIFDDTYPDQSRANEPVERPKDRRNFRV